MDTKGMSIAIHTKNDLSDTSLKDFLMFLKAAKKIILKALNNVVLSRLKKKIEVKQGLVVSRFTQVRLEDGSQYGDIVVGANVMLNGRLISQHGGKISLADGVNIRKNTMIGAVNRVEIGVGVIISNDVVIVDNNNHPTSSDARKLMVDSGWGTDLWQWKHSASAPIVIEDNVWLGQYSRVNKGVRIGKNSIVAANSVVTKNVPPNAVVAGNPARIVKYIE